MAVPAGKPVGVAAPNISAEVGLCGKVRGDQAAAEALPSVHHLPCVRAGQALHSSPAPAPSPAGPAEQFLAAHPPRGDQQGPGGC